MHLICKALSALYMYWCPAVSFQAVGSSNAAVGSAGPLADEGAAAQQVGTLQQQQQQL
jgi:hypothetical protein